MPHITQLNNVLISHPIHNTQNLFCHASTSPLYPQSLLSQRVIWLNQISVILFIVIVIVRWLILLSPFSIFNIFCLAIPPFLKWNTSHTAHTTAFLHQIFIVIPIIQEMCWATFILIFIFKVTKYYCPFHPTWPSEFHQQPNQPHTTQILHQKLAFSRIFFVATKLSRKGSIICTDY